jgi:hypothetical protein
MTEKTNACIFVGNDGSGKLQPALTGGSGNFTALSG